MLDLLVIAALAFAWVGHCCIWTAALNNLYGRPLPKPLLRWWRHLTAFILLSFPLLAWPAQPLSLGNFEIQSWSGGAWSYVSGAYLCLCLCYGLILFPIITIIRAQRKTPAAVAAKSTRHLDFWHDLGGKLIGDGNMSFVTRLPGNGVFRLDITDVAINLPGLPPAWDGLTILVISDVHFHGTPSRLYFERIIEELLAGPAPDLVCLLGDYLDSDSHHDWLGPIFGRLEAREAKLAILGNHDLLFDPERVRSELKSAGYTVLGNDWREIVVRGAPCTAIGHEGPWFTPEPDLSSAPERPFRLCLSHTPDQFYWAQAHGVGLMLCGHVHGGGVRVPVVGSIFVPSVYGRRFDEGIFEEKGTVMVVSRGVSGKEPIRWRCNPQVIRLTLRVDGRRDQAS